MSKLALRLILMLGLFAMSCATANTGQKGISEIWVLDQTTGRPAKVPAIDRNGQPIEWEKEIEAYNADPKNEDKIICRKMKPTGSNIPLTVCQTTAQIDNRRKQDQEWIEWFRQHS